MMKRLLPFLRAMTSSMLVGILIGKFVPFGLASAGAAIVAMALCICSFIAEIRHDDDRPHQSWDE